MIKEKLNEALKELGIPYFFVNRSNIKAPCIVYNFIESPNWYADDSRKGTRYTIILNVYSEKEISKLKQQVRKTMEKVGFLMTGSASTLKDDTGYYNSPMNFIIDLQEE